MTNSFETALKNTLNSEVTYSENGAVMFKTSSKPLVDINFALTSLRNKSEDEIIKMFSDAYYADKILAIKWVFMARDCREGSGERRTFRICLKWLANVNPTVVQKLITLISTYGRFDDIFCLAGTACDKAAFEFLTDTFVSDYEKLGTSDENTITLLGKWAPSENTSSPATRAMATRFRTELGMTSRQYRKALSALRKHLNVIEQKMSAREWSDIIYEHVPSKANIKYKDAFLRNDETRRREFLGKLEKGEVKINSSVNFPSDIVHAYTEYSGNYWNVHFKKDIALEEMWKALPNVMVNGNVLCVCDGSGSMEAIAGRNSSVSALEVCNALGIYCAEHCTGPFKNKYITFSAKPQYVDLSKVDTLAEKLNIAYTHNECANTNIEATFDLVLQTVIEHKLTQEDIPTLVILSDMNFDAGSSFNDNYSYWNRPDDYSARRTALMEQIRQKWASHNLKLPRTIWWNICGNGSIPLQQNELGVILCSGYSQNQFKMIASNKTDPYDVLLETLNSERYAAVEEALGGCTGL